MKTQSDINAAKMHESALVRPAISLPPASFLMAVGIGLENNPPDESVEEPTSKWISPSGEVFVRDNS